MTGPTVVDALPNGTTPTSAAVSWTARWALACTAIGWRVHPVEGGGKQPLFSRTLPDPPRAADRARVG